MKKWMGKKCSKPCQNSLYIHPHLPYLKAHWSVIAVPALPFLLDQPVLHKQSLLQMLTRGAGAKRRGRVILEQLSCTWAPCHWLQRFLTGTFPVLLAWEPSFSGHLHWNPQDDLLFQAVQVLADVCCHGSVPVNPGLMFPIALSRTETDGSPIPAFQAL